MAVTIDESGDALDQLFAAERAVSFRASPALMARVAADARKLQPRPVRGAALGQRLRHLLTGGLRGGFAVAGMAGAALAGLWLGLVPPAPLADVTDALWQDESVASVELIPDYDDMLPGVTP